MTGISDKSRARKMDSRQIFEGLLIRTKHSAV
jgi:hypothetical protein